MEAASQLASPPRQLSLIAGGATVDTAKIGSLTFAALVAELERELPKGADVELRIVARVTAVDITDKYDSYGNVKETVRAHDLRIDQLTIEGVQSDSYELALDDPPAEPDPED